MVGVTNTLTAHGHRLHKEQLQQCEGAEKRGREKQQHHRARGKVLRYSAGLTFFLF